MTDNVAVLDGFNKQMMAYSDGADMFILVKPDTDLDSRFKAWDSDNQEYVYINGWLFTFEAVVDNKAIINDGTQPELMTEQEVTDALVKAGFVVKK